MRLILIENGVGIYKMQLHVSHSEISSSTTISNSKTNCMQFSGSLHSVLISVVVVLTDSARTVFFVERLQVTTTPYIFHCPRDVHNLTSMRIK